MPCMGHDPASYCQVYRSHLKVGNPFYHGEVCGVCGYWLDTPADKDFKSKLKEFYESCATLPPTKRKPNERSY